MKKGQGFTLIELLITVAIAAILLTVAVPGFSDLIRANRTVAQANDFMSYLNFAKSEALKRNASVTICSRDPAPTAPATHECLETTTWSNGLLVFVDTDEDGVYDSGETLVKAKEALSGGSTLIAANKAFIRFIGSGATSDFGSSTTTEVFTLEPSGCTGNDGRSIKVNPIGKISIVEAAC